MKIRHFLILALLLPVRAPAAEMVDKIVAVVGGEIITESDVRQLPKEGKKEPLTELIHARLLDQEMEKLGIEVSDGEIAEAIQGILSKNKIGLENLKAELVQKGIPYERYKKDIAGQIRKMKFIGRVIVPRIRLTEEEVDRKAGKGAKEEAKMRARQSILEERIPDEMDRYLEELQEKSYVEIKK